MPTLTRIFEQETVQKEIEDGDLPEWAQVHNQEFRESMFAEFYGESPFPCYFGVDSEEKGWPLYTFCESMTEKRKSRLNPHGLEITAQPRKIFKGITGDTKAGQRARQVIRKRLRDYDEVPPHPDLGNWGEKGDREWKQYMLPESNDESHTNCPFEVRKTETSSVVSEK